MVRGLEAISKDFGVAESRINELIKDFNSNASLAYSCIVETPWYKELTNAEKAVIMYLSGINMTNKTVDDIIKMYEKHISNLRKHNNYALVVYCLMFALITVMNISSRITLCNDYEKKLAHAALKTAPIPEYYDYVLGYSAKYEERCVATETKCLVEED